MQVVFYDFKKMTDSTARPTDAGTLVDVTLKDETSIINPVLILRKNLIDYNYVQILRFRRYYFVRDIVTYQDRWEVLLEIDPLASFKTEIGASTQYVLRSESDYNGAVTDTAYPTTASVQNIRTAIESPFVGANYPSGTYVLGIIGASGGGSGSVGAVTYYAFTQSQITAFNSKLLSTPDWVGVPPDEISEELLTALFNPYQYVVSARWFPMEIGGTSITSVPVGWWSIGASCKRLTSGKGFKRVTINLPRHPQAAARGNYLNLAPYTRYVIDYPPFGRLPLDTSFIPDCSKLQVDVDVDYVSGMGRITVSSACSETLQPTIITADGVCSVPIQLGQVSVDYLGTAATAVSGVGGTISKVLTGDYAGAVETAASGIESTIKSAMPQMQTSGSNGSITSFIFYPALYSQFWTLADEYKEKMGRPLCQKRVINTLSGYIMCSNADIKISGTLTEAEEIKEYMNRGFYYE